MELSDPLEATAQLYDSVASELDLAAQHCRVASSHFRNQEIPRGAAHAWAAYGHLVEAQERLHEQAREHARRSVPETLGSVVERSVQPAARGEPVEREQR